MLHPSFLLTLIDLRAEKGDLHKIIYRFLCGSPRYITWWKISRTGIYLYFSVLNISASLFKKSLSLSGRFGFPQ